MSLKDFPFTIFSEEFEKTKERYALLDDNVFNYLSSKVSEEFAFFLKEEGFCSYENGLFFTINPLHYSSVLADFELKETSYTPLVLSAFGDIIFYDGVENIILHTSYNERYTISSGEAIKTLFILQITDEEFQEDMFKKNLFNKAYEKLGKLKPDELYGFVPAIPLGGTENLDNIEIVKAKEYLSILSQCF